MRADIRTLSLFVASLSICCSAQTSGGVRLQVDLGHTLEPYAAVYSWFGYDEANYTSTPAGQLLIDELESLSPGPVTLRAHNLLTSGDGKPALKWSSTNVYTEDSAGRPIYNWAILDSIFDVYVKRHVRPFVELGFMPQALSTHPDPYSILFPGKIFDSGWSYPPKDYAKWGELIYQVVHHFVGRYGTAQVRNWYFEVWNEPDIGYWKGTEEDYNRLYDYAAAGARRALPLVRVGGPATTGPDSATAAKFLGTFLDHCAHGTSAVTHGPVPLDFISFHAKGHPAYVDGHVQMGLARQMRDVANGFDIIHRYPRLRSLPVILSESDPEGCGACSAQGLPERGYRNSSLYPAYTAAAMKTILDLATQDHIHLEGILTWAFEFEGQPYFSGLRSLSTNGIDKPELNVFRMAGILGGDRVSVDSSGAASAAHILSTGVRNGSDVDGLATSAPRQAAVLLWNYRDDDVTAPSAQVNLEVEHLGGSTAAQQPRRELVEQYRIDRAHSNAFTVWQQLGSPQHPSSGQLQQMEAAGQLELIASPQWMTVTGGQLSLHLSLPSEGLALLRITWE